MSLLRRRFITQSGIQPTTPLYLIQNGIFTVPVTYYGKGWQQWSTPTRVNYTSGDGYIQLSYTNSDSYEKSTSYIFDLIDASNYSKIGVDMEYNISVGSVSYIFGLYFNTSTSNPAKSSGSTNIPDSNYFSVGVSGGKTATVSRQTTRYGGKEFTDAAKRFFLSFRLTSNSTCNIKFYNLWLE